MLGPIEILGAVRPFARPAARDLVVFLALHPRGASSDRWATALWPDRVMAPATLHATASAARRALGRAADGDLHLPRSRGRLRLGPAVGTDWDRLALLARSGCPEDWRRGLALVRGRPFDGLASPDWTVLEGFGAGLEEAVVELALRVGEHELVTGDPRAATMAARRGLLVSPGDERLYRILFRAADAAGHPAGVEEAMAELLGLIDPEAGRPVGRREWAAAGAALHPSTAALYRTLSRRPVATDAGGARL